MKQQNKYVDFVSDGDFLECVEWVCSAYPKGKHVSGIEELQKNMIDPFKSVFDIANTGMSFDDWVKNETIRQEDKTINNRIGEFHQKLLGKVEGWKDVGVGDDSKIDIIKGGNKIFVELKNKFNTMNSDATAKCREKLENAIRKNTHAKAYWAYIVSHDGSSGESVWVYSGKKDNKIRKIWGKKVYEMVTGNPDALEKTWKALPKAIEDITKLKLSKDDESKLLGIFRTAFQ